MLVGSYDYRLVILSVVIATFASYAALDRCGTTGRLSYYLCWLRFSPQPQHCISQVAKR